MMRSIVLVTAVLFSLALAAQTCPQPATINGRQSGDFFNDEQENGLGNMEASRVARTLRVIEDPVIVGNLQAIGERIVRQMPSAGMKFQFLVVDMPDANAFTIPGGHIYVTRKLIAVLRSEDELAGVIGHELGHALAHDGTHDLSRWFKAAFSINHFESVADAEERYHQYLENYARYRGISNEHGDREQGKADEAAVYAVARAGYNPAAVADFWDRFTETKGRKGNRLTDMFGGTSPESKRLRGFADQVAKLPAGCADTTAKRSSSEFQQWQATVKAYTGFGKKESVPGLVKKVALNPWLINELDNLRFSPDGRYILAQDETTIFVLSRDPLKTLFQIDAREAFPAQFTPDSAGVVFHNSSFQVQKWSITEQQPVAIHDVYTYRGCMRSLLSPDGAVLACLQPNREFYFPLEMTLLDVASSEPIFVKKPFVGPVDIGPTWFYEVLRYEASMDRILSMGFSPDAKYFLASVTDRRLLVELASRKEIGIPGSMARLLYAKFAFLGPDRLVGIDGEHGEKSAVVSFPAGKTIMSDIPLGPLKVSAPAHGDYVLLRPMPNAAVGVFDLNAKKVFMASKSDALDVSDGAIINERVSGELALYERGEAKPRATLTLPRRPLPRLRTASASADLTMLAASTASRGAVWDASKGNRTFYVRGFQGADFANGAVFANFAPKDLNPNLRLRGESEKDFSREQREAAGNSIGRMDLGGKEVAETAAFQRKTRVLQLGAYVLLQERMNPDDLTSDDFTWKVREVATGKDLWSRQFTKGLPSVVWGDRPEAVVLVWDMESGAARQEVKGDDDFKKDLAALKDPGGALLVETLELRTGRVLGRFPLATGNNSFRIVDGAVSGKTIALVDSHARVLIYDLKGVLKGKLFGGEPMLSPDGKLLAIETEPGRVALYDVAGLTKTQEFTLGARLSHAWFDANGKRLAALSDDQTLYFIDISQPSPVAAR